jgi:heat shock protein HslJ
MRRRRPSTHRAPAAALALLLACARAAPSADAAGAGSTGSTMRLAGTEWVLADLAGRPPLDGLQATLAFPAEGRVAGTASCNRFTGAVTVRGDSIAFGPLATTRMACPPAIAEQETRYLAALEGAVRASMDGASLLLHPRGGGAPLRFTRRPRS